MTDNGKIFGKLDWFSCMFYNTSTVHILLLNLPEY